MDSREVGVNRQGLLELGTRSVVVVLPGLLMRHHLVHLRRVRSGQGQAQHRFAGKIGVDAVGSIQNSRIGRVSLAHRVDHPTSLGKILTGGVELQKLHADLHLELGLIHHRKRRLEATFPVVDEPKLKAQIGIEPLALYTASQDLAKASGVVNAMRQADPANPAVLYAAYRVYSDLAGESMLSLALAAPDSAQMHQVMAHEEARQNNNDGARAQFEKALAVHPNLPGIHFELAELLSLAEDPKVKAQAE